MPPAWSLVTVEHVRQACELYDSGKAVPKRPAKSTYLLLDGKPYPAKFIRGLAYRIATGTELDPSRDYGGGAETVRFFENIGLTTRQEVLPTPMKVVAPKAEASPAAQQSPTACNESEPVAVRIHREPQKQALAELLRRRFGTVEMEATFPWLTVPPLEKMDGTIRAIYDALQAMRGYSSFATFGKALCCDFFIPNERLLIEYDERQHFTLQRAKALELYPTDLALQFKREEWIAACRSIQAMDPTPPYRDEQRAFYDSLRDILAARNGIRLIRLRYGAYALTGAGADKQMENLLTSGQPIASQSLAMPSVHVASGQAVEPIRKVALVSHDYNVPDSRGLYDYSEHFARINRLCDEQGCDTILYALYTWHQNSPVARNHDSIFAGLANVQRVILEVGRPPYGYDRAEIWQRGQGAPLLAYQRFAKSTAPAGDKQAFLADLPQRHFKDSLLVLCGESNIASLVRSLRTFQDRYQFVRRLDDMKVRLIFNPIHDYMRRYEMRKKRCYYSQGGRTVISVWNQGKGNESHLPWTIFRDGIERTDAVQELPRPFNERPDIRIGIVDLSAVGLPFG